MLDEILSNELTEGLFYSCIILATITAYFGIKYRLECNEQKRILHKKAVGNGKTSKYA